MRLRSKILSYSLPLFLIPFLLTALSAYYLIVRTYESREKVQKDARLGDSISQIRIDFRAAAEKAALLAASPSVSAVLRGSASNIPNETALSEVQAYIDKLQQQDPYTLQIDILGRKLNRVLGTSKSGFKDPQQNPALDEAVRRASLIDAAQSPVFKTADGQSALAFLNSVGDDEILGVVILIVDTRAFQTRLSNHVAAGNSLVFFDDRGMIWSIMAPEAVQSGLAIKLVESLDPEKNSGIETINRQPIGENGQSASVFPLLAYPQQLSIAAMPGERWYLGMIEPHSVPSGLRIFQIVLLTIVLVTVAAVIYLSAIIAKRITQPIEQVSRATTQIAKGQYELDLDVRTGDEVEALARSVSKVSIDLEEYQKRIVESARLAAMGEMTSEISHEIQNRISGVSLWLQHLDSEISDDDERKEYVDEMKLGLEGFIEMLRDLKAFYKKPVLDIVDFEFNELVAEAYAEVTDISSAKTIEFETRSDVDRIYCEGDREKLKGVLLNLIINAIEASPDCSTVVLETRRLPDQVVFRVSDEGPGIKDSEKERIFNPFYSTKASGSGLGLAISQKIVSTHGGKLTVATDDSSVRGAVFELILPIWKEGNGKNSAN